MRRVRVEDLLADKPDDAAAPGRISFHYIKSAGYRVIHVDGAHGGVTPHGYVQMTLLSERHPTPQRMTYEVKADNRLGDEIEDERVSRGGLVRELEVTALMDYRTAVAVRDWLNKRIEELKGLLEVKASSRE